MHAGNMLEHTPALRGGERRGWASRARTRCRRMSRSLVFDFLKERLAISRVRAAFTLRPNRASKIAFVRTILFYYDETNKSN